MVSGAVEIIKSSIKLLLKEKQQVLVAIDGRCAAGKTTLAAYLQMWCSCNIIHMDHFFLRPEQRTVERMNTAGGNVNYEGLMEEVLIPLKRGKVFSYRPFNCKTGEFEAAIQIDPQPVTIIEGSYSCHPALCRYYDLTIFLTIDESEQMHRIECRNGKMAAAQFYERWIPLEEHYFSAYSIAESCDLRFQTGNNTKTQVDIGV